MKLVLALLVLLTNLTVGIASSQAADTPPPLDVVTLKDGSKIYGEVVEMAAGVLVMKTPASPDSVIKVKWSDVTSLAVNHPIPPQRRDHLDRHGDSRSGR
jgi:hypothetical protein